MDAGEALEAELVGAVCTVPHACFLHRTPPALPVSPTICRLVRGTLYPAALPLPRSRVPNPYPTDRSGVPTLRCSENVRRIGPISKPNLDLSRRVFVWLNRPRFRAVAQPWSRARQR